MHSSHRAEPRHSRWRLAYLGLAVVDAALAGSARPVARRARALTKPLLMPALAASTRASSPAIPSTLRSALLAGQACSWGGDVALLASGTRAFAAGTGWFGLAHAAYLTGFRSRADRTTALLTRPTTLALVGVTALSAPVLARGASREAPVLGPAVAAYAALITVMAATAMHLEDAVPTQARRRIAAGAVLFLASDTALGLRAFVLRDLPPALDAALEVAVMATYTTGQLLLAEGAVLAG